jgi:hypothetical protein
MRVSVLTGKNGLRWKRVMPWRCKKRSVSSRSYSGLFLIPAKASAGERLPVSLNTPPNSTGTYANLTPVRSSIAGITRCDR